MKRLAAALLGLVLVSVIVRASDYDLYIYDESRSVAYDSSEYAGIASEEVSYQAGVAERVMVAVEEDPGDPDVLQLGFLIEIWVDGTLVTDERELGDVDYYTDLLVGSTIEAYMWPISEWTVTTVDFGSDSADGTLDGFAITIKVNDTVVFDEPENGEVDYAFEVVEGDMIDVTIESVSDDYDIELRDEYGVLIEYSDLTPTVGPEDWIRGEVGGTFSSAGHTVVVDDDSVVVLCGAVKGGGSPLGLILVLFALPGLSTLARRAVSARA